MDKGHSFKIFIGLVVGTAIGIIFNKLSDQAWVNWTIEYVATPMGVAFLRALMMIVVPLVFASLAVGVRTLGSGQNIGLVFGRLGLFYISTTLVAILIGQVLVNAFQPGAGISEELMNTSRAEMASQVASLVEKSSHVNESLWPGLVSAIIPKNILFSFAGGEMLAVIFVSIIVGLGLLHLNNKASDTFTQVLESISDLSILVVGWIMKFAPYAVAALMVTSISKLGFEIIDNLAKYVLVVCVGYLAQLLITYPLVLKFLLKISPIEFYRKASTAMVTAFSTSSSNATIPTTTKVLEEDFNVSKTITNFSVPLGATVNMDGTALFEMVAAIFVAQVFHVDISLVGYISLILLMLFTSIGVAGVPGGSIPILMSAMAMVGIPPEGIALVIGVDRLLDMGRTTVNVTGDMTAALFVKKYFKRKELSK
ncbi:MAG: dicarboxylate/amino acid:cation symporter [Bdellovibrionales bacterium]|nr:dicarboxylate/amino acid:cation symporter [Bdellovibrionales bacterium]